eukprot:GHVS01067106.1.p1 GENE.GHVS01067106.1~~GHVS01067106.1.p1  ORF type:complete len:312 (-),score=36.71 GHVS01067106.1:695-1630(-)
MHGSRGARCGMDLPYQGRAICSCAGELPSGSHRYIASTSSPRMPNQLRVVEHIEHTGEVTCLSVVPHSEEVRAICAIETYSPAETLITAYRNSYNSKQDHCRLCTTVVEAGKIQGNLVVVCEIDSKRPFYRVNRIVTSSGLLSSADNAPTTAVPSSVGVVDGEGFRVYDFSRLQSGDSEHEAVLTCKHTALDGDKEGPNLCSSGCFDPHHTRVLITVGGSCLNVWDIRTNKISSSFDQLHGPAKSVTKLKPPPVCSCAFILLTIELQTSTSIQTFHITSSRQEKMAAFVFGTFATIVGGPCRLVRMLTLIG